MYIFIMKIKKSMLETRNLVMMRYSLRPPRALRDDILRKFFVNI